MIEYLKKVLWNIADDELLAFNLERLIKYSRTIFLNLLIDL